MADIIVGTGINQFETGQINDQEFKNDGRATGFSLSAGIRQPINEDRIIDVFVEGGLSIDQASHKSLDYYSDPVTAQDGGVMGNASTDEVYANGKTYDSINLTRTKLNAAVTFDRQLGDIFSVGTSASGSVGVFNNGHAPNAENIDGEIKLHDGQDSLETVLLLGANLHATAQVSDRFSLQVSAARQWGGFTASNAGVYSNADIFPGASENSIFVRGLFHLQKQSDSIYPHPIEDPKPELESELETLPPLDQMEFMFPPMPEADESKNVPVKENPVEDSGTSDEIILDVEEPEKVESFKSSYIRASSQLSEDAVVKVHKFMKEWSEVRYDIDNNEIATGIQVTLPSSIYNYDDVAKIKYKDEKGTEVEIGRLDYEFDRIDEAVKTGFQFDSTRERRSFPGNEVVWDLKVYMKDGSVLKYKVLFDKET